MARKRCSQSGKVQMLAWLPDDRPSVELDGKPYPGAVVCLGCSKGILVRKGSVHPAISESGFEGFAGTVKVHDA